MKIKKEEKKRNEKICFRKEKILYSGLGSGGLARNLHWKEEQRVEVGGGGGLDLWGESVAF